MFAGLGLPVLAMLVLILATWTTNTGNAYMSGLAVCKMFSIKDKDRPKVTMGCYNQKCASKKPQSATAFRWCC